MFEISLAVNPRSDNDPGFFVKSPTLRHFSVVEEDPDTDFSRTRDILKKFLDVNIKSAVHEIEKWPSREELLQNRRGTVVVRYRFHEEFLRFGRM